MAIVYFLIGFASTFVFYSKYRSALYKTDSIFFAPFAISFIWVCIKMFRFGTNDHRGKFVEKWEEIKSAAKPEDLPALSEEVKSNGK